MTKKSYRKSKKYSFPPPTILFLFSKTLQKRGRRKARQGRPRALPHVTREEPGCRALWRDKQKRKEQNNKRTSLAHARSPAFVFQKKRLPFSFCFFCPGQLGKEGGKARQCQMRYVRRQHPTGGAAYDPPARPRLGSTSLSRSARPFL